jgi:hypothetical protein
VNVAPGLKMLFTFVQNLDTTRRSQFHTLAALPLGKEVLVPFDYRLCVSQFLPLSAMKLAI